MVRSLKPIFKEAVVSLLFFGGMGFVGIGLGIIYAPLAIIWAGAWFMVFGAALNDLWGLGVEK